jgi:hypothetical protein
MEMNADRTVQQEHFGDLLITHASLVIPQPVLAVQDYHGTNAQAQCANLVTLYLEQNAGRTVLAQLQFGKLLITLANLWQLVLLAVPAALARTKVSALAAVQTIFLYSLTIPALSIIVQLINTLSILQTHVGIAMLIALVV